MGGEGGREGMNSEKSPAVLAIPLAFLYPQPFIPFQVLPVKIKLPLALKISQPLYLLFSSIYNIVYIILSTIYISTFPGITGLPFFNV